MRKLGHVKRHVCRLDTRHFLEISCQIMSAWEWGCVTCNDDQTFNTRKLANKLVNNKNTQHGYEKHVFLNLQLLSLAFLFEYLEWTNVNPIRPHPGLLSQPWPLIICLQAPSMMASKATHQGACPTNQLVWCQDPFQPLPRNAWQTRSAGHVAVTLHHWGSSLGGSSYM